MPSLSVATIFLMTIIWCCVFAFISVFFYTAQRYVSLCCHKVYSWVVVNILGRQPPIPPMAGADLGRAIPSTRYCTTACYSSKEEGERDDTCSICLTDMESSDMVKELACRHCYHAECLQQWLLVSTVCPLCKQRALPPERQRRLSTSRIFGPARNRVLDNSETRGNRLEDEEDEFELVHARGAAAEERKDDDATDDGYRFSEFQSSPESDEIEFTEMPAGVRGSGSGGSGGGGGGDDSRREERTSSFDAETVVANDRRRRTCHQRRRKNKHLIEAIPFGRLAQMLRMTV